MMLETILSGTGAFAAGGIVWKLVDRWLRHREASRKQTDDVAMDLVEKLTARLDAVEGLREADRKLAAAEREADRQAAAAENAGCEARVSDLRHELRNVDASFEALLLALKHAPQNVAEIVADVVAWREARRRRPETERRGALRNETQARMSAERVVQDVREGMA